MTRPAILDDDLRQVLGYAWIRLRRQSVTAAAACLVAGASAIAVLVGSAWLIGVLSGPVVSRHDVVLAALCLAGTVAVSESMSFTVQLAGASLGLRLEAVLRREVLVSARLCEPADDGDREDGPDRFLSSGYTPELVVLSIGLIAVRILTGTLATALLTRYAWWLPLVVLPILLLARHFNGRHFRLRAKSTVAGGRDQDRMRYLVDLSLSAESAKEWRLFGLQRVVLAELRERWRVLVGSMATGRRSMRNLALAATVLLGAATTLVMVLVSAAAADGRLSLPAMALLVQAALAARALTAFSGADIAVAKGIPDLAAAIRFAERAGRPDTAAVAGSPTPAIRAPAVVVEGVRFTYPGANVPTLDRLDLHVAAGRCTAIVGPNGAGKSTLLELVQGFRVPQVGRVLVDGQGLSTMDISGWQRRLAVVRQDFVRYPLSVCDNIALGGAPDRRAVRSAAGRAGLDALLNTLPDGLDTELDPGGGMQLSGGQWQRLALARMLHAVDHGAAVVLLDEPTAALDARAELRMFTSLLSELAGRTVILVSHRFASVRLADHIVVLDGGRVVERGDHDALMALDGYYAHAFRLQADPYLIGEAAP